MTITWLGTPKKSGTLGVSLGPCVTPPCSSGTRIFDPTCPSGTVRCRQDPVGTTDFCAQGQAYNSGYGGCVPITCPSGTTRDLSTGQCESNVPPPPPPPPADFCTLPSLSYLSQETIARFEACWNGRCSGQEFLTLVSDLNTIQQAASNQPAISMQVQHARNLLVAGGASKCTSTAPSTRPQPAPGECLSPQQVLSAQPCFYLKGSGEDPSGWQYAGPPELLAGANPVDVVKFCIDTGYTDLLKNTGDGYFVLPLCDPPATLPGPPSCITPDQRRVLLSCPSGSDNPFMNYFCWIGQKAPAILQAWVNTPDCPPGTTVPAPTTTATAATAKKSSSAVPLLIGAAVVGAAVYFLT